MNLRLGASLIGLALLAALVLSTVEGCAPVSAAVLPTATPIATPEPIRPPTASPVPLSRHAIYVVDPRNGDLVSQILVVDPDARRVERTFQARYTPDIAFSPEGKRLYVADSYNARVIRGKHHDVVSVYDAATGELLHDDVEVPTRLLYKVFPSGGMSNLVISRDGKRLFVGQYGDPDIHALRLAVVDTDSLAVLGEFTYPCGGYQLLPLADGRLVCAGFSEPTLFDPSTGKTTLIAAALPASSAATVSAFGDRLYLVSNDANAPAYVTVVDLAASPPDVLMDHAALDVPTGSQVSLGQIALSPDELRLYVGFVHAENRGSGTVDEIDAFDTRTWQRIGALKPTDPAWQFAASADGAQFYTVNPFKRSLSIFDAATFAEIGVMRDLGDTPALIVVPPN